MKITKQAKAILDTMELTDMKIIHATVVSVPIYRVNIVLIVNEKYENGAMTSMYSTGEIVMAIPQEMLDSEVITHEAYHATSCLSNHLGLECEESKAYLNGFINEACLNYFGVIAKQGEGTK